MRRTVNIVTAYILIIERFLKLSYLCTCAGECKKALSSTNINEMNGDIMCTTCHRRQSAALTSQRINSTGADRSSAAAAVVDDNDDDDDVTSRSITNTVKQHYVFVTYYVTYSSLPVAYIIFS